ncbi:MAG TPA: glycosyltransferase 87 family protein [Solirubrobacterales bacterium]
MGSRARIAPWLLAGLGALALGLYLYPRVGDPGAHWPLWDVRVYWWGGQQALHGAALYGGHALYHFTYPPFAAALFGLAAPTQDFLEAALTVAGAGALALLCWLALGAAGVRRRPAVVFAAVALSLLLAPVVETLRLGEVNLILAALVGVDLLGRRDGARWQGVATGVAAGIKLTPLIFVVYLAITGRVRAAIVAAGAFGATIAAGFVLLPSQSWAFWPGGLFLDQHRVGSPLNPGNQSISGALARAAGSLAAARPWWLAVALPGAIAGLALAAWAHRRGHRLAGVVVCALTGLLVSPFSWAHHWVWAVPLFVLLGAVAWRRRTLWPLAAAAALGVAFSGLVKMPWPGRDPDLGGLLAGDLYVLCGLAVLAAVALALTREPVGLPQLSFSTEYQTRSATSTRSSPARASRR